MTFKCKYLESGVKDKIHYKRRKCNVLDNFIYSIMICKMVNAVSESGNYWIANNFIWGWLLIPIMVITEIIKRNNYKPIEIIRLAEMNKSYNTELSKGIKLSKFVILKSTR